MRQFHHEGIVEPGRLAKVTRPSGSIRTRRRARRRTGAAAVEFAFVFPLFIYTVFASIDFGRVISVLQLLTNSARAGDRVGILPNSGYNEIKAAVNTTMTNAGIANAPDPVVEIQVAGTSTWVPASGTADLVKTALPGTAIRVKTSVLYSNITWCPNIFMSNSATLTSYAIMTKE